MAEIYIKGKTNGSLISIQDGRLVERLPSDFNVTSAVGLKQLEQMSEPGPDTFTLHIEDIETLNEPSDREPEPSRWRTVAAWARSMRLWRRWRNV